MQFSERMAHIKPSATLTINAKALELKSQGVDVTSLAIGEPNFPTPAHVCDAAKQAIDEGFTRYTAVPGIPPLREAIAGYFKRAYGVDVAPDCTIASNGGKQSLYNLFAALLNDGDEVLIPSPYWVSYPDMVYLNGGVPVAVKAPASQGFKVTVEQLEAALTPKAKILVFNSPSNPTGACYSVSERDAIVKWALDRGLFIIADEIYDQLVYEPNKPSSIIVWWKQYPDRIAVVNGLAKSFAMTGWRVGYTVTHPDLVKKLSQITGQATGNICSVSQKAAVAALTGPYDCVESMRQAFQKRRDMAWKEIASWSNVVCPKPEGAFYLFADISALYDEKCPTPPPPVPACSVKRAWRWFPATPSERRTVSGSPTPWPTTCSWTPSPASARSSSDNNADLRFRGFPEPENAARGRHFSGDGMHTLDWKHAWTGRLLTTAPTRPQALKLLEPQLDSCNARLIGEVASGKLPFLNLPFRSSLTARLKALTPQLRRFKHMVVLGIGGSALGTRALQRPFPSAGSPEPPGAVAVDSGQRGRRRARSADVHPQSRRNHRRPRQQIRRDHRNAGPVLFHEGVAAKGAPQHVARAYAARHRRKEGLPARRGRPPQHRVPAGAGPSGRAVFRPFRGGARPRRLHGLAVGRLPRRRGKRKRAARQRRTRQAGKPPQPSRMGARELVLRAVASRLQPIDFLHVYPLMGLFRPVVRPALGGKPRQNGKGTMPLPAVGVTDQHSLQQMFLDGPADKGCIQLHCPNLSKGPQFPDDVPDSWEWLRGKTFGDLLNAETLGSAAALVHNGVPLTRLEAAESSMRAAGEVMGLLMATTVLTGWLMNINPLDQPAVELGKRLAYSRLGSSSYPEEAAILKAFLD